MGSAPQTAPRTVNITVSSKPITQMFDGSLIPVDAVRGFSDNCLPHRSNAMSRLQIAAATKQTIRTPANTGGVAIDIRKNKPKSALFTLIIRSCLVNSMGDRARCIHQFAVLYQRMVPCIREHVSVASAHLLGFIKFCFETKCAFAKKKHKEKHRAWCARCFPSGMEDRLKEEFALFLRT